MAITHNLKQIDLLVYGGTEAGIFAAVQAARCGLKTVLVSESSYLFGFFPSLGAWETHYAGCRAQLSWEVRNKIIDYYRHTFGEKSKQFRDCINLEDNNPMVTFEPHVAEKVLQELLDAERENLIVIAPAKLKEVDQKKGQLKSVTIETNQSRTECRSPLFVDCSYTGDLAAKTGASFSIGRESRSDYDEPHAGQIFTRWKPGFYPQESVEGKLNVLPTWTTTDPLPGSTGKGDDCVQDYSYRICLSSVPENQVHPNKPAHYDREKYAPLLRPTKEKSKLELPFHHRWLSQTIDELMDNDHLFHGHALPGNKRSWNATNFTGAGKNFAASSPADRKSIENRHKDHAIGLLYFLQNDPAIPSHIQKAARLWGLARDEFRAYDNFPPALYIREARRFKGSYMYREQDCLKANGLNRAPIHRDGIVFTEFALDSLPCTPERWEGSNPDGQFFEKDKTLPGTLPWRCLLPLGISNLVVPSAPSVTHCAWGTVRQSACLLNLAEVCAFAAELCKRRQFSFAKLPCLDLQIHLVQNGTMISFFNDFDMQTPASWKEAALLFGNRGFFGNYDAKPNEPLDTRLARIWIEALKLILSGNPQPSHDLAIQVHEIEHSKNLQTISSRSFAKLLGVPDSSLLKTDILLRMQGLETLYSVLLASRG